MNKVYNTKIIYKLSDSFSLIVIKCPYSKLLAYIHESNFNIRHVYAYICAQIVKVKGQLSKIWEVSCDWSVFWKGISYSVEQTLVGGNKSSQDVCEGGYVLFRSPFGNVNVRGSHVVVDRVVHSFPPKSVRFLDPGSQRAVAMQALPDSVFIKRVQC